MGKFSQNESIKTQIQNRPDATINYEGGIAFDMDSKTRLYTEVVTSLFSENKFYETAAESDAFIRKDIIDTAAIDPEFVLQLAAFARNQMNMRSVPQVILAECSVLPQCKQYIRKYTPMIIKRADEPSEVIAYWISRFGQIGSNTPPNGRGPGRTDSFPNSLKKGIADSLSNFDEYQLSKYDRKGSVKLRDVLRLVHPVPKDEARSALYKFLLSGDVSEKLPIIFAKQLFTKKTEFDGVAKELMKQGHLTWEVAVSQFGNKKEIWDSLDLPIFATVRNLRNMMQCGADMTQPLAKLTNGKIIEKSRMFPYRFYTALKELEYAGDLDQFDVKNARAALSTALELSVDNVPTFPGRTVIFVDLSASMDSEISRSKITRMEIGALFGAIAYAKSENALIYGFGQTAALIPTSPNDNVLTVTQRILDTNVGHSTNAWEALNLLGDTFTDRLVMFSDEQLYDDGYRPWSYADADERSMIEGWTNYTHNVNPNAYIYSVDLAGYGTAAIPLNHRNAAKIAGWSDKIYDFISTFESDKRTTVTKIKEMYSLQTSE